MAFGKLFVRAESGETTEYSLTRPSTTIGRQPGNDIVLNTTAVSRYHARLDVVDGQVVLVDLGSANGTFVNDVPLEPGGSMPISHGDKLSIGDKMLIYTSPQARGRLDINLSPTPTRVEGEGLPFRLVLDEPQQLVAPGARMQLILIVESLSDRSLTLAISTSGLDDSWLHLDRNRALLEPGEQTQATITVLPPRNPLTRPGRYALTVHVAELDAPHRALETVREIDVVGYAGLAMDAQPEEEPGQFLIAAHNDGNIPLDIDLGAVVRNRALRFDYEPPRLQLAPGELGQSLLTVNPQVRRLREPVEFAVVARSRDAAGFHAPVQAYYVPPRRVARWPMFAVLALLALMLAALMLAGGAWALGLGPFERIPAGVAEATDTPEPTPGPTPTIIASPLPQGGTRIRLFRVNDDEVTYRTAGDLVFSWQVTGDEAAGGFIVLGASGPVDDERRVLRIDEVAAGNVEYPIAQLEPGNHNFRLIIVDEDGGELAQQVAGVSVEAVACRVLNPGVAPLQAPEPNAPAATPARESAEVLLAGRTEEADWLWVAYNDLTELDTFGWLPASEINCPPGVPVNEIVVVPPEGDPLLLATDEAGTPELTGTTAPAPTGTATLSATPSPTPSAP